MAQVKDTTKVVLQYEVDGNTFELLLPPEAPLGQIHDACVAFGALVKNSMEKLLPVEEKPVEEEETDGGTE